MSEEILEQLRRFAEVLSFDADPARRVVAAELHAIVGDPEGEVEVDVTEEWDRARDRDIDERNGVS